MPADPALWRPTVGDVAAVIPNRTGDPNGNAQGTFTAATIPTAAQVETLITSVQGEVIHRAGPAGVVDELAVPTIPQGGPGSTPAGHAVAVGVASYVELNFYPDLQQGSEAPAQSLWRRYQWILDNLFGADPTTTGTEPARPVRDADWAFPAAVETGKGTTLWERF